MWRRHPPTDMLILQIREQDTGIEPAFSAWEADVLPIYESCIRLGQAPANRKILPRCMCFPKQSLKADSNRRPTDYESVALPAALLRHTNKTKIRATPFESQRTVLLRPRIFWDANSMSHRLKQYIFCG